MVTGNGSTPTGHRSELDLELERLESRLDAELAQELEELAKPIDLEELAARAGARARRLEELLERALEIVRGLD